MHNSRVPRVWRVSRTETGNVQLELDPKGAEIVKKFVIDVALSMILSCAILLAGVYIVGKLLFY